MPEKEGEVTRIGVRDFFLFVFSLLFDFRDIQESYGARCPPGISGNQDHPLTPLYDPEPFRLADNLLELPKGVSRIVPFYYERFHSVT